MLGDSFSINNVCCNPVVLKKIGKTSKALIFWTRFAQKRGHYGSHSKSKTTFLVEITNADHQLSENFYFIKISYILAEL